MSQITRSSSFKTATVITIVTNFTKVTVVMNVTLATNVTFVTDVTIVTDVTVSATNVSQCHKCLSCKVMTFSFLYKGRHP